MLHKYTVAELGVDEAALDGLPAGIDDASVDEKLKPLLRYVQKLTRTPSEMTAADAAAVRASGWSEDALFDAICICGFNNLMNRVVDAVGLEGTEEEHRVRPPAGFDRLRRVPWPRRSTRTSIRGDDGTRTHNPHLAKVMRYQLRHVPGGSQANGIGAQSSLVATALGVTFIFGSYSASSIDPALGPEGVAQRLPAVVARPVEALLAPVARSAGTSPPSPVDPTPATGVSAAGACRPRDTPMQQTLRSVR